MALFTTLITTPLVHFVYVRHLRKTSKYDKTYDNFAVFMGIQHISNAPWLVSIANLFIRPVENFVVKAILFHEISDRPSSYFFSEYYTMIQEAPVVGKKRKLLLSDIKTGLTISGADIQTKSIGSADLATDVANYANTHGCDVLLLDLPYTKEGPKEKFSLSASLQKI